MRSYGQSKIEKRKTESVVLVRLNVQLMFLISHDMGVWDVGLSALIFSYNHVQLVFTVTCNENIDARGNTIFIIMYI